MAIEDLLSVVRDQGRVGGDFDASSWPVDRTIYPASVRNLAAAVRSRDLKLIFLS
jgi:hypothetical protein